MRPRPPPDIGRISPRSDARARAQNRILAALVAGGYRDLVSRMERVVFQHGDVVCEPGDAIRYVYFPETVVISMLSILENGDTLEVGLVGSEGMGLSTDLLGSADLRLRIPLAAGVESLNATIAAAVVLFEIHRRRG